jgi:hypothetical protein
VSIEILLSVIVVVVIIFAGVLSWRLVGVIQGSFDKGHRTALRAMDQMQTNHGRILHKMEDWHDQELRAQRAHMERVMEVAASPESQAAVTARQHAMERNEEAVTAAKRSTNERTADLHEALQTGVGPDESKPPGRVPVPRSKASQSRTALNEGRIPERHR